MEDDHVPLISNHRRRRSCCRNKYRPSCVRSKGAVIILILCFFAFTIATNFILSITLPVAISKDILNTWIPLVFGIFAVVCLSFPFLGLLGEKWMRYKVIIIGFAILCISYVILYMSEVTLSLIYLHLHDDHDDEVLSILIIAVTAVFSFPSLCLFEANVIQFGTDQLQFAPSEELSSFIHWFTWVYALPNFFYSLYNKTIMSKVFTGNPVVSIVTSVLPIIVCILFVVTGFFCICCFKRYLVIEPAQHNNPIILIWRVMKYAWKHKQPVKRSAFTYGEPPPSRLDLGKERYGGPFTTEQVENVKSFWNILPIIFGTIILSFLESNLRLLNDIFSSTNCKFVSECVFFDYPAIIPYGVVVVSIPIHQLLIVPYFSRYIPSMLKRIWIGLVLVLVQLVVMTINFFENSTGTSGSGLSLTKIYEETTITQHILIVLQFFEGISIMLVFTGSLEFILAQAPRTMQGILIGLFLMQYYFIWNMNELISSYLNYHQHWWVTYSTVITCLALIPVIVYTIAACRYKYRQRNELSDVNERVIITQYFERQLDREEQLHRLDNEASCSIESRAVN